MIANILSSFTIIVRAYFYFNELTAYVITLDILSLLLFSFFIIYKKKYLYPAILTFLPSISIYLLIAHKPISDLLFVSFLTTLSIIAHKRNIKLLPNKEPLILFMALYLLLIVCLLSTNLYNLFANLKNDTIFLKYFDYLFLTVYSSLTFLVNFDKKDMDDLANALLVAMVSYLAASMMGYFYFDYQNIDIVEYEAEGFTFLKNLLRYPGLSSSNYVGHIILLMVFIVYSIRSRMLYLYALIVIFTSIVTQSRTVFYTGMIFLSYCAFQEIKDHATNLKMVLKQFSLLGIAVGVLFLIFYLNEEMLNIALQFKDRLTMEAGSDNIMKRYDIISSAVETISASYKKLLFGVGYIPSDENPHNSILQAMTLFGLVPSCLILFYYVYLVRRIPLVMVIMVASFGEILFYTASYDFLFFILILVNIYKNEEIAASALRSQSGNLRSFPLSAKSLPR